MANDEYVTNATIYSEIYNPGGDPSSYRPVAYYYVDGRKYVFVEDRYIEGNLEDSYGNNVELYYDPADPSRVAKVNGAVSLPLIIIGVFLTLVSLPTIVLGIGSWCRVRRVKRTKRTSGAIRL